MGNFIVTVVCKIPSESVERLLAPIAGIARRSVTTKPGCREFDVSRSAEERNRIVLGDDLSAFEAHGTIRREARVASPAKAG